MKKIIIFCFLLVSYLTESSAQIAGSWKGKLDVGGASLNIVFHISEENGSYKTTMDSPDQGAKGIPTTKTTFEKDTLIIDIRDLMANFKGSFANDEITGTFTQGGYAMPLKLKRGTIEQKRPQTPQEPFPYNSENVVFENKSAGIKLAGTLTYPKQGKNFPLAILVSGSGAQNRDEELLGHKPFLVLSDFLTRQGIAVLRYDDRGTAESEGDYKSATIDDFKSDALAAMAYAETRKEINKKKIGIIGHSEGGLIAFLIAGEFPKTGFIVTLAGPAVKGDSLLKEQRYLIGKASGASDEDIQKNEQLIIDLQSVLDGHSAEYIESNIDALTAEIITLDTAYQLLDAQIKLGIQQFASPELSSLMAADPREALTRIKCPVLALNGEKDIQVPAGMNLNSVRSLVKSPLVAKEYPGLNHLFQRCKTCTVNEYGALEETMSTEVLEDIAAWILTGKIKN